MMLIQTMKLGIRGQVEVQRMTGDGSGTVETGGTAVLKRVPQNQSVEI
jgi:hypothetical protein